MSILKIVCVVVKVSDSLHVLTIYILKVVVVVEVSDLTSLVIRGSSHNIYIYLENCGSDKGLRFTACSHNIYLESCGSGRGLRFNIPSHKRQFSQYIYIS